MTGFGPKERLLETASRLFFTQGYQATGINQILKEAKVAKASLYQHYGSKEDLGVMYLKNASDDWFKKWEQFAGQKQTPLPKLMAMFDFLEYAVCQTQFKGCRFVNMMAELATTDIQMQEAVRVHKTKVQATFVKLVSDVLPDKDHEEWATGARTCYLLFEGAVVESKIYQDVWPVHHAKQVVKKFMQG